MKEAKEQTEGEKKSAAEESSKEMSAAEEATAEKAAKRSLKASIMKRATMKKASVRKAANIGLAAAEEALAETTEEHTEFNERTPLIPRLARRREDVGSRAFSWIAEAR